MDSEAFANAEGAASRTTCRGNIVGNAWRYFYDHRLPKRPVTGRDPYRVNVTTGVSERYGAVLFARKSLLAGTEASTS